MKIFVFISSAFLWLGVYLFFHYRSKIDKTLESIKKTVESQTDGTSSRDNILKEFKSIENLDFRCYLFISIAFMAAFLLDFGYFNYLK